MVFALLSSIKVPAGQWPSVLLVEVGRGMPALVMLQLVLLRAAERKHHARHFPCLVSHSPSRRRPTRARHRAGLRAVPAGELEAADALGLSKADRLGSSSSRQGLRIALPALMGFAILIFQISALASRWVCPSCSAKPIPLAPQPSDTRHPPLGRLAVSAITILRAGS